MIDQKTASSDKLLIGRTVLPPGARHDKQGHPNVDEFFVVIKGSGHITTDTGRESSGRGDVIFTPRGHRHGFDNTGTEDAAVPPSSRTILVENWTKPAAEPELAVHLEKTLSPGSDRATTMHAIAGLGPAIELADVDHPSEDVEGTLSRNIYQRHLIMGPCQIVYAAGVPEGLRARVERSGVEIADMTDLEALTGELISIVQLTANVLGFFGETLDAGHIIIAGSITKPIWVQRGEDIVFHLLCCEPISIHFPVNKEWNERIPI